MNLFQKMFFNISNFFSSIKDELAQAIFIAIIIGGFVCIVCTIFLFAKKSLKNEDKNAALHIILSTILGCIFMVPITLSFSTIIKIQVQKEIKNMAQEEIKALKLEVENEELRKDNLIKQNEIMEKNIRINSLNSQVALLKSSQVSAMQFQKIAEIALIKTNIQQTRAWNGAVSDLETGWGVKADYYDDNLLLVNTYDIDAKFGIDFNKIKVKKISDNKIQISGIEPTYIGSSKNVKDTQIKEIRRYDYDSQGNVKRINVKNDSASMNLADSLANELDKEYQASLENMSNWTFLTDAIIALGENFTKIVFAPVYDEIIFTNEVIPDALPIREYIESEIKNAEIETVELDKLLSSVSDS